MGAYYAWCVYDSYKDVQTLASPSSSKTDKALAAVFLAGSVFPGGKIVKTGVKAVKIARHAPFKKAVVKAIVRSVDDIVGSAGFIRKTKGGTYMYEKAGGYSKAVSDFNSMGLQGIKKTSNGGLTGKLSNGTRVNVHKSYMDGQNRWTLEIGNKKIRYDK
ncbi:MAG: hypothetical protein ACM3MK_14400 [Chitinophagales bacterium]